MKIKFGGETRLEEEIIELEKKIVKLNKYIDEDDESTELHIIDRELLIRQEKVMFEYSCVLNARIGRIKLK